MTSPTRPGGHPAAASGGAAESHRPAIGVEGLRAGYGDSSVLHGVNLAVRPREIFAILGEQGGLLSEESEWWQTYKPRNDAPKAAGDDIEDL